MVNPSEKLPVASEEITPIDGSSAFIADRLGKSAITIGFSTTNKLISRIIRWITRGAVSHAWVAFFDPYLKVRFVLQAESWGFEMRPWVRWRRQNRLVKQFSLEDRREESEEALLRLVRLVGVPYDWRAAGLSGLLRWFGVYVRGRFRLRPARLMCAESVITFLKGANFDVVKDLDAERTTPAELLEIISLHPNKFRPVIGMGEEQ